MAFAIAPTADGSPIATGNLVILRVGTGPGSVSAVATAAFLDEYTPAGGFVQTISIPSTGEDALTLTGSQAAEGTLTRSQDGTLLTFTGYRKNAGGSNPSSDTGATTNRVIGTLSQSGLVNTSLAIGGSGFGTGYATGAATVNGSDFYHSGQTGVRYIGGSTGVINSVTLNGRTSRQSVVSGNQLIVSDASTAFSEKINNYGTLPTAVVMAPTAVATITSTAAVNSFFMADLNPGVAGDDTIYALDVNGSPGVQLKKYTFDGVAWNLNGSIGVGVTQNITGVVSGTSVNLYLTSPSQLFSLTDASGAGGTLTGALGPALVTASSGKLFRGINVFVPEPSTTLVTLSLLGARLLLGRRRSN